MYSLSRLAHKEVKQGGYCELESGELVGGQFKVQKQLGRGRFSTVWSAEGLNSHEAVALKVYRSGDENLRYFYNEVMICNKLRAADKEPPNLIRFLGFFTHTLLDQDLAPVFYPCVAFSLEGDHLGRLLRYCADEHGSGLPVSVVKRFFAQILRGLDHLHKCGIIHTDIKPGNILMNTTVDGFRRLDDIELRIADIGSASTVNKIFSRSVGTVGYLAPENILGLDFGTPMDIWSAFAVCYELATSDYLFDVYDEDKLDYGADVNNDLESPITQASSSTSDSSSSDSGAMYRHLLLFEKLLGPAPKELTKVGREYYNAKGRLKWNPEIEHSSIEALLRNNYSGMSEDYINSLSEFLQLGLRYLPEERITAEAALQHPFLQ